MIPIYYALLLEKNFVRPRLEIIYQKRDALFHHTSKETEVELTNFEVFENLMKQCIAVLMLSFRSKLKVKKLKNKILCLLRSVQIPVTVMNTFVQT